MDSHQLRAPPLRDHGHQGQKADPSLPNPALEAPLLGSRRAGMDPLYVATHLATLKKRPQLMHAKTGVSRVLKRVE